MLISFNSGVSVIFDKIIFSASAWLMEFGKLNILIVKVLFGNNTEDVLIVFSFILMEFNTFEIK